LSLLTVVVWIFYVCACLCLGALLVKLLGAATGAGSTVAVVGMVATAFLLGQGVLAQVWIVLGLLGRFSPLLVAAITGVCVLGGVRFAWPPLLSLLGRLRATRLGLKGEPWSWRLVGLLTLCLVGVQGLLALVTPPGYDAEAIYMVLPKLMVASHRLAPLPGLLGPFAQIGLQGELHYAALMSMAGGGAEAPKLFAWAVTLGLALMVLAVGSLVGLRRRGQWIALVAVFTSTALMDITLDGKVDQFGAAMGVAALYWALQIGGAHDAPALRLAGLFTGLAVIAKFSLIIPLAPAIVLLVTWRRLSTAGEVAPRPRLWSLAKAFLLVGLWMVPAVACQLLKNGMLWGEPLAPFISAQKYSWFDQMQTSSTLYTPEVTRWIVLTYPFALVFGQYHTQYGDLSPLLLAFAPLAAWLPRPRPFARSRLAQLTLAGLVGLAAWVALRPGLILPRYYLPLLLAFIPLAARGAEYVEGAEDRPRWLSTGIVLCVLVTLGVAVTNYRPGVATFVPRFLAAQAGGPACYSVPKTLCRIWNKMDQDAQPGDRVLLTNPVTYWLRSDLQQCAATNREIQDVLGMPTNEERWTYLFEHGFRYIMVEKDVFSETETGLLDPAQVPDWLNLSMPIDKDRLSLFRLESKDPSRKPRSVCRQDHPPAWDVVDNVSQ
jgi:hypothetical protein